MASIHCAHCKNTHTSVAAVRACAQGAQTSTVATLTAPLYERNVVTLREAPGQYWEVQDGQYLGEPVHADALYYVTLITSGSPRGCWVHGREITEIWGSLNAAAEEAVQQMERTPVRPDPQPARRQSVHGWAAVDALRDQVQVHLHREERGRQVGYFALLVQDGGVDKVKFYRVRTGSKKGKWANHVFVDAQASDDYYPVRAQDALTAVLEGILADPAAAGLLYATELGRCCRCARTLTDETSRARGIGPECFKKI